MELVRPIMGDSREELQERITETVKLAYNRTGEEIIKGAELDQFVTIGGVDCNPGYPGQLTDVNRRLDLDHHNRDVRVRLKSYYKPTDLVDDRVIAEVATLTNFADRLDTRHLLRIARQEAHSRLPASRSIKLIILATMSPEYDPSEEYLNLLTYLGVRIAKQVPYLKLGPVQAQWKSPPHAMPDHWAA